MDRGTDARAFGGDRVTFGRVHSGIIPGPRTEAPPSPQRGTRAHEFFRLLSRKEPWREHAACRGHDSKHWYPEKNAPGVYEYARTICNGCPVRDRCLTEAIRLEEYRGMWGGQTPSERGKPPADPHRNRLPWSAEIVRLLDDGQPWRMCDLVSRVKHLIPREKAMSYLRSYDGVSDPMWSVEAEARGQTAVVHSVCRQLKHSGRATVEKTDRGFVVQVRR